MVLKIHEFRYFYSFVVTFPSFKIELKHSFTIFLPQVITFYFWSLSKTKQNKKTERRFQIIGKRAICNHKSPGFMITVIIFMIHLDTAHIHKKCQPAYLNQNKTFKIKDKNNQFFRIYLEIIALFQNQPNRHDAVGKVILDLTNP